MFRSKPLFDNWDLGGGQASPFAGWVKHNARDMFVPLDSGNNDPDANRFIAGAGIVDEFQKVVIQELVKNLKMHNLWDKLLVCYPIIGGTAARHGFNLKDYTTFNASFVNSPTHNSLGVTFNGTTQYMNTLFNPRTVFGSTAPSCGQCIYWSNTSANAGLHGADSALPEYFLLSTSGWSGSTCNTSATADGPNLACPAGRNSSGFVLSSRLGSTPFVMANKIINSRTIVPGATPNRNMYVGCRNSSGSPSNYGAGTVRWYAVHYGFTTNEATTLNKVVQRYQERLNRAVY